MKEEMPAFSFESENELISAIQSNNYDFDVLLRFSEKYVENKQTNNTERMAEFICSEMR